MQLNFSEENKIKYFYMNRIILEKHGEVATKHRDITDSGREVI